MTNTEFLEQLSLSINGLARVGEACERKRKEVLEGDHDAPNLKLVRVQLNRLAEDGGVMVNDANAADAPNVPDQLRIPISEAVVKRSLQAYLDLIDNATVEQLEHLFEKKGKDQQEIDPIVYKAVGQCLGWVVTVNNFKPLVRKTGRKESYNNYF